MYTPTKDRLGFLTVVLAFFFSLMFIIEAAVGLSKPWDVIIPIGASLLLAPSYKVLIVAVR